MQNTNEIREHISAIEETRKITNAMQLVSTARLKRVMDHIDYNHRYFQRIVATMRDILASPEEVSHPYLVKRGSKRQTFIVIAADKGLCGSYNTGVLELAYDRIVRAGEGTCVIAVGIVAQEYLRTHGIEPDIEIMGMAQDPSLHNARALAYDLFRLYDDAMTDEVFVLYTSFYGETKNKAIMRRLLPVMESDYDMPEATIHAEDIRYEPSAQDLFTHLVPQYVIAVLFGALVQAYASEQLSRMIAMQNATQSADEMLQKLHLTYNLARQTAITQEIAEISGAAEALREG
ncbi:MAG: ATP synthase F1 subunit gamma [Eubacteriales bacterium]|nr:ATP synthase F1 subunit gamma [Eubacteriales bacterium]